jgi:hypothetical protein
VDDQIAVLLPKLRPSRPQKSVGAQFHGPDTEEKAKGQRHSNDQKVEILREYTAWIEAGKPFGKSPASKFKGMDVCHYNYPNELYGRVKKYVEEKKRSGRPVEFPEETWTEMLEIMASYQAKTKNKTPSSVIKHELAESLPRESLGLCWHHSSRRSPPPLGR